MADAPVAQLQHKPPKKGKLVSLLVIGTLMAGEGVGVEINVSGCHTNCRFEQRPFQNG